MNLAVHGLEGDIREANTFYDDVHTLVGQCDFDMANPPFNVDMVDAEKVEGDPRLPFGLPGTNTQKKVSNGNHLWISYFYSYLNETGRAGFVMSSQASSAGHGERDVRRKIIEDVEAGYGRVSWPYALERTYLHGDREWMWPSIFPAARRSIDPCSGIERRHHMSKLMLQRAVKAAVRKAGITKAASCHTFRHACATHWLEAGSDIRTVHELVRHQDVHTTTIYTHVLNRDGRGVRSPGDLL